MRLEIKNLAALDLSHATAEGWVNRVESLLAAGVDPNALYHGEDVLAGPHDEDALNENATQLPHFYSEPTEMPALRRALRDYGGNIREGRDLAKTAVLMTTLLKHNADPYALFRQPVFHYESIPVFPGDVKHPKYDDDESDLRTTTFARQGIFAETLEQEYKQLGLLGASQEADIGRSYEFDDFFKESTGYEPQNLPMGSAACYTLYLRMAGFVSQSSTLWVTVLMWSDGTPKVVHYSSQPVEVLLAWMLQWTGR